MKVASTITGSACNRRRPITCCRTSSRHPPSSPARRRRTSACRAGSACSPCTFLDIATSSNWKASGATKRVLHHDPLHLGERLAARSAMSSEARDSLIAASQFRRHRRPAGVVIGVLGEHQRVGQARIRPPGPGRRAARSPSSRRRRTRAELRRSVPLRNFTPMPTLRNCSIRISWRCTES